MLFVKDVYGNLVNLAGKDVVIQSLDDWDMFGEFSHMVKAKQGGAYSEMQYPTEFVLWHGTLKECEKYVEFLADHIALGADLRMVHQPKRITQTPRPKPENGNGQETAVRDLEEFPF